MSRKISRVMIHLHVGEKFVKELRETMEDEMVIASKKWNVALSSEKQDHVIDSAFSQLLTKISEVAKVPWRGEPILQIRASNAGSLKKDFSLPAEAKKYRDLSVVRMRDGWTFTSDESDDVVPIPEFYDEFVTMVHQWARTAVFYGVASYT